MDGALGRGKEKGALQARDPSLSLNGAEGTDVFDTNKRKSYTMVSAIAGSLAKLLGKSDTTDFVSKHVHDPGVAVYIPQKVSERDLRDDSTRESHSPQASGPAQTSRAPQSEFLNDRKETPALDTRANRVYGLAGQKPAVTYNGHSEHYTRLKRQ
jgi:hypothetical protein